VLDPGKALLAARGDLQPSVRARAERIPALLESKELEAFASLRETMSAWAAWRLAPAWPPPEVPLAGLAGFSAGVLRTLVSALGIAPAALSERRGWRRLLAQEGGAARERIRRWRMLLASRPAGIELLGAGCFALRWAASAWPATLGILAFGLAWIQCQQAPVGTDEPQQTPDFEVGALITREIPMSQSAGQKPAPAIERAGVPAAPGDVLRRAGNLVRWVREAGA
jgi:hypothetical protein